MGAICGLLHLLRMTRQVATPCSVPRNLHRNPASLSPVGGNYKGEKKEKKTADNKAFLDADNKDWCTVLQPIFIPRRVYLLHKCHLSRILLCHCCFLCNIIIIMMYESEKGAKPFIIRAREESEHI